MNNFKEIAALVYGRFLNSKVFNKVYTDTNFIGKDDVDKIINNAINEKSYDGNYWERVEYKFDECVKFIKTYKRRFNGPVDFIITTKLIPAASGIKKYDKYHMNIVVEVM